MLWRLRDLDSRPHKSGEVGSPTEKTRTRVREARRACAICGPCGPRNACENCPGKKKNEKSDTASDRRSDEIAVNLPPFEPATTPAKNGPEERDAGSLQASAGRSADRPASLPGGTQRKNPLTSPRYC